MKTILFLCTGNYYRSRFAEELFNHHAERVGLDWVAQSRGLALERGAHNVGPISPFALHALKEMVITPRGADRFPRQCTVDDLAAAEFPGCGQRNRTSATHARTVRKMGAPGGLLERA